MGHLQQNTIINSDTSTETEVNVNINNWKKLDKYNYNHINSYNSKIEKYYFMCDFYKNFTYEEITPVVKFEIKYENDDIELIHFLNYVHYYILRWEETIKIKDNVLINSRSFYKVIHKLIDKEWIHKPVYEMYDKIFRGDKNLNYDDVKKYIIEYLKSN